MKSGNQYSVAVAVAAAVPSTQPPVSRKSIKNPWISGAFLISIMSVGWLGYSGSGLKMFTVVRVEEPRNLEPGIPFSECESFILL